MLILSPAEMTSLLAAVATGDRAALQRLYGATCAKLYGVVLRILRRHDLATNVMADAYRQIWDTAAEFDPARSSALAWMVAIARARAIDLVREPQTTASEAEPEIADAEAPGALPRRELTEDLKRLLACIGRLEPDRQRMVLLAYYGSFTRHQLAGKLDLPAEALTAALRHSLAELEQCLPFMTEGHEYGARAAEYVLGTLDTAERAEARALLGGDDKFAVQVKEWERRLGELHLMVEPVEPEWQVWERVKTKIGGFDATPAFEPPAADQIEAESSSLPPLPPVPPPMPPPTEEPAPP